MDQPQSMHRHEEEEEDTWDDPLRNVLLQLGAHLGLHRGVPVGAVVNQQEMGVVVVQAVQGVPLQVIHDVVGQVAPLGAPAQHRLTLIQGQGHTRLICVVGQFFRCVLSCFMDKRQGCIWEGTPVHLAGRMAVSMEILNSSSRYHVP